MYGVTKTTIYMPDDLRTDLKRVAEREGKSVSDLIREGARKVVDEHTPPKPRALFASGDPDFANPDRIERELREGFGRY